MSGKPGGLVHIGFLRKFNLMDLESVKGNMVDCIRRTIMPVTMNFQFGKVVSVQATGSSNIDPELPFIIPGFVDAHVHIESSMLGSVTFIYQNENVVTF